MSSPDLPVRVEIITSRTVPLGGPRAMTVHRTLPQRQRSLIGAWCFIDHFGPDNVSATGGMDVAPHPHTGLQTVSWLFDGAVTHHDSGGHHAVVLPGEVNLMTAGAGICHSEVSTQDTTTLHGVQLWTALPDSARRGKRRFEHYVPTPRRIDGGAALVFIGTLLGSTSPVATATPLVGAELRIDPGATLTIPVDPAFEHGLLVDSGDITLAGVTVAPTELAYTGVGETILTVCNRSSSPARAVLIGGEPFTENIVMWWNFLGRNHDEIARYRAEWHEHSARFGEVVGYISHNPTAPARLPAPALPHAMIRPRSNPAPIARPDERID